VVFEMAGFRPDTILVTLRAPFVSFAGGILPSRSTTQSDPDVQASTGIAVGAGGITNAQAIRAGGTLSRTVTFQVTGAAGAVRFYDTTGVRSTVATATFPVGAFSTPAFFAGGLRLDAVAPGVDTITVTLPGATTAPSGGVIQQTVVPGAVTLADTVVQVGAGLLTKNTIGLDGHSIGVGGTGHQGVTLTLRVLEPGIALLQADDSSIGRDSIVVTLPAGAASVKYYVAGLEGVLNDTVQVVATAPGLHPDTLKVVVRKAGLELQPYEPGLPAIIAAGEGARDIYASIGVPDAAGTTVVIPQMLRPGSGLSGVVTFTVDNPGVAVLVEQAGLPEPIKMRSIGSGTSNTPIRMISGGVGFQPLTAGQVLLSVATPGVTTVARGIRPITVTP
ncbi:MAG TPA: hypothetical protein VG712_05200, partial [Gemmatimonadales bacterium]|nr:hypothetical protein [Gemmatimonadales bacterium]